MPPAKRLIVYTEKGSQVLPGLCRKPGLASKHEQADTSRWLQSSQKCRRQSSTQGEIAASLSALGRQRSWGYGAPPLQWDTNLATRTPAQLTTGSRLGAFSCPLTLQHLIHLSAVFPWPPDPPKRAAGGLPHSAPRASRLQAPHQPINQPPQCLSSTLCPPITETERQPRGVSSFFTNFSRNSLHGLSKEQDRKPHCPLGQGRAASSRFFCIFPPPFACLVVLNNLRGFYVEGSIFLSVQTLLHLGILSPVTAIFHGLTRLRKWIMCYSLHKALQNSSLPRLRRGELCCPCCWLIQIHVVICSIPSLRSKGQLLHTGSAGSAGGCGVLAPAIWSEATTIKERVDQIEFTCTVTPTELGTASVTLWQPPRTPS